MVLPNFIGIGAAKSGTTWLHELLKQHPEIYMPTGRKELNFFNFNNNYNRGLEWYESFFPTSQDAAKYLAIGEFTPRYLSKAKICAPRIASIKSIEKLILILRNPVDRTYSQYGHAVRSGYNKSFDDFLIDRPWVINQGFYARNLEAFLEFYTLEQICCLVFEQSVTDVDFSIKKVSEFLQVSPEGFLKFDRTKKYNKVYTPRFRKLNLLAAKVHQRLAKSNFDWTIDIMEKLKVRKIISIGNNNQTSVPPMSQPTKLYLQDTFARDIEDLEKLLNLNIDIWRFES